MLDPLSVSHVQFSPSVHASLCTIFARVCCIALPELVACLCSSIATRPTYAWLSGSHICLHDVHDSKDLLSCPAWNNILFSYCSCLLTVAVDLNPQTDESAVDTPRRNCSEAGSTSDISCAMSAAGRHASFRLCGVASVCMIYGCSLVEWMAFEPPPPPSPFRHCHCVSTNNIHSSTCRDHIV